MITKEVAYLPEGLFAVTKGSAILGFVRGKDAGFAYMKATEIFGEHDGTTSVIIVQDTK